MKIVQHLFDSSKTDQVAFARKGDSFTELRLGGMQVGFSVRLVEEQHFRNYIELDAKHDVGFSRTAMRNYLRNGPNGGSVAEQEALFANISSNCISRISTQGNQQPLELLISAESITCLRTSLDGRYIAVGNGDGQFELWNMDMAPERIFSFGFHDPSSIADLCFSRSNLQLYVATTCGTIHSFDLHKDQAVTVSAETRWPCYSVDVQQEKNGIVFGGEDGVLWTLDVKGTVPKEKVSLEEVPFRMERASNVTGAEFWRVAAMPRAQVGRIRTTVGSYISQVRFLRDDLICALGPKATEVWSLEEEEPHLVARQRHDQDCRLLSFGGTPELVRVALGRAM
ncbi:MAG: WD40 repeat domain-containing protein [Candidatus Melainabacteria bacterium]|nr:WD40 repeat domain-containing protein [Candidatus Melainabacteria bacterium]